MDQIRKLVARLTRDVGTPRALAVNLLTHYGEWAQLQELRCRPSHYLNGVDYYKDVLVTELLRKCDLPSKVDKEGAAIRTFFSCEAENFRSNRRLERFLPGGLSTIEDEPVFAFIMQWRKDISAVLGNLPVMLYPRFSRGATYADNGSLITIPDKMSSTPTIYEPSRCLIPLWEKTSWYRAVLANRPSSSDPRNVKGNVFFPVPKDGTTFRGCCKEASIAVAYQLDVGVALKKRLSLIGIDLRKGQDLHRQLARDASVSGDLATIDMSNASDTLCRVLPEIVLRSDWWELVNSLRAPMTRVKGKWFRLEKFSSMGNGFTFELESLIFATLARVIVSGEGGDPESVKCYGDDLIVPVKHVKSVLAALRYFGFTPNEKKTFLEGPFRESCGGDFWAGTPVRGYYVKKLPDEPQQWIALANGLRAAAEIDGQLNPERWSWIRKSWLFALDQIPVQVRSCRGPKGLGDIVIHDDPSKWNAVRPPKDTPEGAEVDGYVRAYVPIPVVLSWHHWSGHVQLACCTLGLPSDGITPRGGVSGYRFATVSSKLTCKWLPS